MGDRLYRFLTENMLLKLISLGFAIVLWMYVSLDQAESEVPKRVSVEIANVPSDLIRTSDLPSELEIKISGPRTVIRGIRESNLRYVLDLNGTSPGSRIFRIYTPKIEGIPEGARVVEVSPSQIQLTLSNRRNKTVRVNPITRGKPAEGMTVINLLSLPESVEVTGAEEEVVLLKAVDTEIIDINGRSETFTTQASLDLVGRHIELVKQEEVQVTVVIGKPYINKYFYGVKIEVQGTNLPFKLARDRIDIQLEGPEEELMRLTPEDLNLILDASNLPVGKNVADLKLIVPEGMVFRNVSLPKVEITLYEPGQGPEKKKGK